MAKEQNKQEQRKSRKPIGLEQKTDQDDVSRTRFKEIRDLLYLEFSFDGSTILNVYDALPHEMDTLAKMYANVSDVDPDVWPVEERLDFVNRLWDFCQQKHYQFPLQIKKTTPVVERIDPSAKFNLV
ncbi:MAG: hypothetical protein AUF65_01070 [Chloroflexi bacterium 13_1_20CM_50_12]|nr:MAG: hypothetical protein AUF65_01070 [Chloroflexi bacterium 13_1_20CM_50_12]